MRGEMLRVLMISTSVRKLQKNITPVTIRTQILTKGYILHQASALSIKGACSLPYGEIILHFFVDMPSGYI